MQPPTGPPPESLPDRVLFFDGVCNLCNGMVQFVIRQDKRKRLHFATLQSDPGVRFLNAHGLATEEIGTSVYWRNGQALTRSTGALNVARDVGGIWVLAYGSIILPRFIRDAVYDFIARNRFRWFGKRDTCMVPSPELKARFLEH